MKKATLIILIQIISYTTISQIKHSINLEYNIGYYFDKYPIKADFNLPIPPSINYQLFFKNNGIGIFIKKLALDYQDNFFDKTTQKFPDSTILSRTTFYAGINYIRIIPISFNINFNPFVGVSYMKAGDATHLGYFPGSGWNEPYSVTYQNKNIISGVIGLKLNYEFYKKVNAFIGISYFNSFNNNIQNNAATFDIGISYIINRRKNKK